MGERPMFKVDSHYIRDFKEEDAKFIGNEILDKSFSGVMKNEVPKTPEEIKLIDFFNTYLSQEFVRLGLDEAIPLPAEKIHAFNSIDFKSSFPKIVSDADYGFYSPNNHAIFLNKDKAESRLDFFRCIAHEMVHAASFRLYEKDSDNNRGYTNYKSGYSTNKFSGLNEAVTDLFVYQFFLNKQEKLSAEFGVKPEEWKNFETVSYRGYCELVEDIMNVIAQKNNEDMKAVWKRFKVGVFSGTMMHLREVENSLEPGALRKLADLGYDDEADLETLKYLTKVISEKQKN